MELLVAWVLFPLVLAGLCLGLGFAVERAAGVELGVLLLPAGFAALVVLAQLPTLLEQTARFTTALVVAAALAGVALARPARLPRPRAWAAAAALATFAAYAAPIVLSGSATFAGFIKLDDTATFLALVDRALEHGRSLDGLPPSTYEATLDVNLARGYPLGALLPLGVGAALVREDVAWVFQPYLAFAAALLALSLFAVARELVRSERWCAACAFVAAQPALLYAYSLWGGVKEIVAAALLALAAAAAAPLVGGRATTRAVLPFALACGALLGALSLGGALWLLVPLAAVFVAAPLRAAAAAALTVVLAVPALLAASEFLREDNTASFRQDDELGNLAEPLAWQQVLGVWPAGDFRVDPDHVTATRLLIVVVALALVGAVTYAAQRRSAGLLVLVGAAVVGAGALALAGSPWVASKALAIASPALLLAAAAAAAIVAVRRQAAGIALLAAIAFGVLWSNALAYRQANLAPRDRLAELEQIGERFAGAGPALLTDYEVYGARHFLRDLAPESASELRRRFVFLRDGSSYLQKGDSADIDAFQLASVLEYEVLVLRRGPATSRPPSPYGLIQEGRYYTVWVKTARDPQVLEHVALGDNDNSAGPLPCREAQRLASLPGVAALVVSPGVEAVTLEPAGADGGRILYGGPAMRAGRYDVFLGGSFRGTMEVRIAGERLRASHRLNWPALYTPLGSVELPAGRVSASLEPGGSDLRPGAGGPAESFGPLVVSPARNWQLRELSPSDWRRACAREWDWIEAATVPNLPRQD